MHSSLWEIFQISLTAHWLLRNACYQKIPDEQTEGMDAQPAGRGGVSIIKKPYEYIGGGISIESIKMYQK